MVFFVLARIAALSGCSSAYSVACFVACGASNAVSYSGLVQGLKVSSESCVLVRCTAVQLRTPDSVELHNNRASGL